MIPLLRRILIISSIIAVITPLFMLYLWSRYISEEEQLYGNSVAARKPCEPYSFRTLESEDRLLLTWKTREKCTGFVLLGQSYTDFSYLPYQVLSENADSKQNDHSIKLLKQDELKYSYAVIVSEGEWFGFNGSPFAFKQVVQ
jgi:hypothetical protein